MPYTTVQAYLPIFDDSTVTFDNINNFYDGFSNGVYTFVPKPTVN